MTMRRGPACLATTFLTLAALGACAQPDPATTIKGSSSDIPRCFAASAAGAFLVAGNQALTVAEPGAKAQAAACCGPTSEPIKSNGRTLSPRSGSVALDGTPWVVLEDASAIDLKAKAHVTATAVRQLRGPSPSRVPQPTGNRPRNGRSSDSSMNVLSAWWTPPLS